MNRQLRLIACRLFRSPLLPALFSAQIATLLCLRKEGPLYGRLIHQHLHRLEWSDVTESRLYSSVLPALIRDGLVEECPPRKCAALNKADPPAAGAPRKWLRLTPEGQVAARELLCVVQVSLLL